MKPGSLWNVALQRMSSSISGTGIQEYELYATLQDEDRITKFQYVSMSISGGTTPDDNYYANRNLQSTGSRHFLSSSNLVIVCQLVFSYLRKGK